MPQERRKNHTVSRNDHDRQTPGQFFRLGTRGMPPGARSRTGAKSIIGTGNATVAQRGERVAHLYTDDSERWMVKTSRFCRTRFSRACK